MAKMRWGTFRALLNLEDGRIELNAQGWSWHCTTGLHLHLYVTHLDGAWRALFMGADGKAHFLTDLRKGRPRLFSSSEYAKDACHAYAKRMGWRG